MEQNNLTIYSMNLLYSWIAIALIFLIIEFVTTTFYGLALALAAWVVASYVYFSGEPIFTITQWIIFAITSLIFAYILPKLLSSSRPDVPQGFDRYIGEKRTVKKVAGDLKISLDGVDYIVESDDEISVGNKVEVIGHKGAGMKVKRVK